MNIKLFVLKASFLYVASPYLCFYEPNLKKVFNFYDEQQSLLTFCEIPMHKSCLTNLEKRFEAGTIFNKPTKIYDMVNNPQFPQMLASGDGPLHCPHFCFIPLLTAIYKPLQICISVSLHIAVIVSKAV